MRKVALVGLLSCLLPFSSGFAKPKPIRALLITGGCCHDYAHQKTVLTEGISARANVVWSIVHEGDGTTDHRVSVYEDPDWAKNYDVIVHDECFADVKDAEFVRGILKPHRNGLPAVNLHCAMHCYRVDFDQFKEWFEFTGLDTRAHGAQLPIAVSYVANTHPILKGLTNWRTVPEELYNNLQIWKTVTPLAYGAQGNDTNLVAWMNDYRGTRVFSTTLGHNTATVADPRYLDLVTRGLLWSVNKLNADYLKPAEVKKKAQRKVRVPVNLALRKKATASASQDGHTPESSVDGDLDSRWCAPDNGNNYWVQVDLGKPEEIAGVRITWEHENADYHYIVAGSADGNEWRSLINQESGARPQIDEQKFSAAGIRYVRITITQAPSGSWASFYEFEVLGKELIEKAVSESSDARLAGVQSPAGFEQTYFAGPPDISYPTCLEATPWGDVFVGVDLNGSLDREKNRGWVVRCRDTNNDGAADNFVTFAKMDSPRGLVFDNNTLYVMHPPVLEAFHDDNGDGVADRSEVLVRGLGNDLDFRGADHTCNGVRMGIDGWLYIALGDYGALNAVAKDGSRIQLHGGGVVRVRPDGTDLEIFCEGNRNIYDVAADPFMNIFTCDNTNDGDGWNLRLSHIIAGANYGYPSLFKNFADEIMSAMKDFGGGSPTGVLFLDEPGFPDEFGRGLYTCQWGWNNVTRHPLRRNGASFDGEKETFIRIPRPTGIAADGCGNIYVASWKGATFNYAGPSVGFVVRVAPLNYQATTFPKLAGQSDKQLVTLLRSQSTTQRLHVQREILRRKPTDTLVKRVAAVAAQGTLATRAAAVFTVGQVDSGAVTKALLKLADDSAVRPLALRALADSKSRAAAIPSDFFVSALGDKNPAVQLEAILALRRLHRTETAARVFPFLRSSDVALSHAAFRTLVSFKAMDVCLDALDRGDAEDVKGALRVLRNVHEVRVIDALIKRLAESKQHPLLLETLCRLYYKEADWDGSWWTTRPDTTGPYYKTAAWEGTERISGILQEAFKTSEGQGRAALLVLLQKYKIELPGIPATAFEVLVADKNLDATIRKKAFQTVARSSDESAIHALLACDENEKFASELRHEFIEDPARTKNLPVYLEAVADKSSANGQLAFAVLSHIAANTNAPNASREMAAKAISVETSVDTPKPVPSGVPSENTIAKVAYDEVVKRASGSSGDAAVGAKLFETVGCVKCHTTAKNDPPKGPFLGDIAVRYSRPELIESILRPSAKVAQGFETTTIEEKNGEAVDGFIVRESGEEIELRNITGATVVAKKDIVVRGTRTTSIMPDGLADALTPEQLASLLRYLESLRTNN